MNEVQDKRAETGIKLNNILTFLVLGVMTWVGTNIELIKQDVGTLKSDIRVNRIEITHLEKTLTKHMDNERLHSYEKEN